MPSLGRKFACLEEYGTEFQWSTERIPNAEDSAMVTTTVNTLVGADVQDVLNKLCRPTVSQKPTYTASDITNLVLYKNATQTTPNRIANVAIAYSAGLPTTETWTLYNDTDGTTILKTVVLTHTWVSGDLTNTTMVTT